MRTGYVLKRYPRYSETFIVAELLAHQAAGLEVEIFALGDPGEPHRQPDVERIHYPVAYLDHGLRGPDRDARMADRLAALVAERGIDHLHAHFATAATTVARSAAGTAGIPYTFTAHAKDIYHRDVDVQDLRSKLIGAARVVTVSDFNRRHLIDLAHVPASRVVRIYNGLDLTHFPSVVGAQRNGRILAVGRLVEKKGFADLIAAVATLARRHDGVGCDIVGVGPLEPELRAQVAVLRLSRRVRFHGAVGRGQVAAMMREASVFAAPCLVSGDGDRDGLPTVLVEAMASGLPCVTTAVTGIPELVADGVNGVLVPERDPRALAGALGELLRHPAMAGQMARRARSKVEREFDGGPNAAALRDVFAQAAQQSPVEGAA